MPSPRSATTGEYRPTTRGINSFGFSDTDTMTVRPPATRSGDARQMPDTRTRRPAASGVTGLLLPLLELFVILLRLGYRLRIFGRLPFTHGGRGVLDLFF